MLLTYYSFVDSQLFIPLTVLYTVIETLIFTLLYLELLLQKIMYIYHWPADKALLYTEIIFFVSFVCLFSSHNNMRKEQVMKKQKSLC